MITHFIVALPCILHRWPFVKFKCSHCLQTLEIGPPGMQIPKPNADNSMAETALASKVMTSPLFLLTQWFLDLINPQLIP